jgi:hypothetical protein
MKMEKQARHFDVFLPFFIAILFTFFLQREKQHYLSSWKNEVYFDSILLLKQLPARYYHVRKLESSFPEWKLNHKNPVLASCGARVLFEPLGHNPDLHLCYTHIYSPRCVYRYADTVFKYAEVAFPNPCLSAGKLFAKVHIENTLQHSQTFYLRLFYQNTSYWHDVNIAEPEDVLDNFYGASKIAAISLQPREKQTVLIPYSIGLDPKDETDDDAQVPARAGNYEFALAVQTDTAETIMQSCADWKNIHPFLAIKNGRRMGENHLLSNVAYVSPRHFKFVFLEEKFDGINDTTLGHLYIPFHKTEKKLCDTCTGWFKDIISEDWKHDEFYKGKIAQAPMIKAEYGQRRENVYIKNNALHLLIPGSTPQKKQKTWGEVKMGQTFKYGHLTLRAKLAPMIGKGGRPNGIIHNIWLYQLTPDPIDTSNPYSYLRDPVWNTQLYEIDFEVWSSTRLWQAWDRMCNINFAVVDYMRNPHVVLKPGEERGTGKYSIDRFPERSANILGEDLTPRWFERFHTFEIIWEPKKIRMFVDGKETASFTPEYCAIPDKHMFLWIGSPIYQDGTYYTQSFIPFTESDKETIIDYIRIE